MAVVVSSVHSDPKEKYGVKDSGFSADFKFWFGPRYDFLLLGVRSSSAAVEI